MPLNRGSLSRRRGASADGVSSNPVAKQRSASAPIYRLSVESVIGSDPDFIFLRTLFGFEAPGAIIKWIVFQAFPGVISGGVAGAIAVKLTEIVCKGARYEIAAFVTGGIYTGLVIMLGILTLVVSGFDLENVSNTARNLCLVIGIWVGLFLVLETLPSTAPPSRIPSGPPQF